ncbi:hypothetical protein LEP1GSC062_3996 [Leptospira alexanderi serovar Manhao 3 str. L 60]|uniref:Uncharacterized protein n=1 Tax=Leptospira alexanderi serovar Manhao 3 str. L 60 TaxID=1049759 RepID=V6I4C5_9LEPT|nr:hypothetical protein LEP1GSC062_3996 [Leptospira alexanderi serovar Manhao 3 str. L 60]
MSFETFILTVSVSFFAKTFIESKNKICGCSKVRFFFLREFINVPQKNCLKVNFNLPGTRLSFSYGL